MADHRQPPPQEQKKPVQPVPAASEPTQIRAAQPPPPECPLSELQSLPTRIHHFLHEVQHGTTLEHVLRPGYWRTVWRQIGRARYTMITVIAVDGTWEADLRVMAVGDGYARCHVLRHVEYDSKPVSLPDRWTVEYVGEGWRVRNQDGEIITAGHPMKGEAALAAQQAYRRIAG